MTVKQDKSERWYTRRDGVVRGPYPAGQISRYILLGRIREHDELSQDQYNWKTVDECQSLIPDIMKLPPTEDNIKRLMMARMREDERQPGDRRDLGPEPSQEIKDRRSGEERRQLEPELFLRHRRLKREITHSVTKVSSQYRVPFIMVGVVLFVLLLGFLVATPHSQQPLADCSAPVGDGVNWDNCHLSGAQIANAILSNATIRNAQLDSSVLIDAQLINVRFDYTSLVGSNLSGSDLTNAVLVGAALNGANLRNAILHKANLSYANLSGALIEGVDLSEAVLDNAIWVDQSQCAPGSVGKCER